VLDALFSGGKVLPGTLHFASYSGGNAVPEDRFDRLVSYFDLGEFGFVNPTTGKPYSRKHLGDLMRRGLWPKAIQVSPNRIAWRLSDLTRHAATRPIARSLRDPADAA
jgi:hypothetical protein